MHIDSETQTRRKATVMARLDRHPYQPPWWLRNPHAQTFWGPLMRRRRLRLEAERVDTPDGDFIYLHHRRGAKDTPRILILHGLEGSRTSFYVHGINRRMQRHAWNSTLLEFRTCSAEFNLRPRAYHMGDTGDVDFVVRTLIEREPERHLFVVGVSLGANVLGNWLGQLGEHAPPQLRAACMISSPFDPFAATPHFHRALRGFYVRRFLKTLKRKAAAIDQRHPGLIDIETISRCTDFNIYDTLVTARLHGFADAEDYWRRVGCHQVLGKIRIPTLLISAEDDPFIPTEVLPREQVERSPWLHALFPSHGGHVGFVGAGKKYWAEEQLERFFLFHERDTPPEGLQA